MLMSAQTQQRSKKSLFFFFASHRESGIFLVIVVLVILVTLRAPVFLTTGNIRDIGMDISALLIVAIAQTMVIITAGIDLSVASTLALCAMTVGTTVRDHPTVPLLLVVFLGIALGALLGSLNGAFVTLGKVPPIIVTLGTMSMYRGLVFVMSGGSWVGASDVTEDFVALAWTKILGIPTLIIFAVLTALMFSYVMKYTRTGRQIYAIGSNLTAAQISGFRVERTQFLVYILSGALAGFAGVLWASRFSVVQNNSALGFELQSVASAVVGGTSIYGGSGTILGTVLGALFIGILANALTLVHISEFWQLAVQGLVILGAVIINALIARRLQHIISSRNMH
ncbi:branched-chain amino acid ABC transporter permease [candidate division KSB3 bacterium]|uniref:Branched-chain amino acid ABC transporter permease n=1 Tax=candidate division KSB3 bacterium TaxID=2044937 RepID=A0A2G6E3W4_9BACT|nr:MAG: branched-chain amino acid ABC transporter permease [candidate division KSB3 bacterium]PIE29343.1 MAG: branched-chain amino acid ABC transporter permease [candidate division KSB3 bacterium]